MLYEAQNGFYKKANWPYITIGILCSIIVLLGVVFTTSLFGPNSTRRQIDELRGQLTEATDSNNAIRRELESCQSRLGQCHFILEELGDTTGRSITTVRDCIDLVEEQRYYIACLSYYIDGGNSDELYKRIDDWLESEGVEFVK